MRLQSIVGSYTLDGTPYDRGVAWFAGAVCAAGGLEYAGVVDGGPERWDGEALVLWFHPGNVIEIPADPVGGFGKFARHAIAVGVTSGDTSRLLDRRVAGAVDHDAYSSSTSPEEWIEPIGWGLFGLTSVAQSMASVGATCVPHPWDSAYGSIRLHGAGAWPDAKDGLPVLVAAYLRAYVRTALVQASENPP
jgi:hypothetical protein